MALSDYLQRYKPHQSEMEDSNGVPLTYSTAQSSRRIPGGLTSQQYRASTPVLTDTGSSDITLVRSEGHGERSPKENDIDTSVPSTDNRKNSHCTNERNTDATVSDWHYTSKLKEKGDVESVTPVYEETRKREYPPLWSVTVTYDDVTATGEAKSKKEAKHLASKKAWHMLE